MTVIRVTQSGGFAGHVRHGTIDTRTEPSGPALEAFLTNRLGSRGAFPPMSGADRFLYSFEVSGRRVSLGAEELPTELASLVRSALGRGRG